MPVAWVPLPPAVVELVATPPAVRAQQIQQYAIDEELVVEAREATFTRDYANFAQGVRATFGPSVLTAESLEVNRVEKWAQARGNVVLEDPAGTIQAEDLRFSWDPENRSALARNVLLDVEGVNISAETAELVPGEPPRWVLTNLGGTSCPEDPPFFFVSSPRLEIVPGERGELVKPTVSIFGRKIATLPTRRFNLDPRIRGIGLPSLDFRGGEEIALGWEAEFLLDPYTALTAGARALQGEPWSGDFRWTRTFLDPMESDALIAPRSDFEERFREGYFNNINVRYPAREQRRLTGDRRILSFGGSANFGTRNDRTDDRYSSVEAAYEVGGSLDELGYQTAIRAQYLRRNDEEFRGRLVGRGTLAFPTFDLRNDFFGRLRLDAATYLGETQFGWVRAEGGILWAPSPQVLVGGALVLGSEFGDAMFPSDRLLSKEALHFRASLDLGPTQISYLTKYDLDSGEWFDREYEVSQVIGCVEAFVLYRQFPSSYNLGIRLRLDDFFRKLRSRTFVRDSEVPKAKDSRLFLPPERD